MKDNYYDLLWHISNSSLKALLQSPKKFKEYLAGKNEQFSTKSTALGTLVHMYILERDKFDKEVEIREFVTPIAAKANVCKQIVEGTSPLEAYRSNYSTKESDDKVQVKIDKLLIECKDYIDILKIGIEKAIISTETLQQIQSIEQALKGHKMAFKLMFSDSTTELLEDIEELNEHPILFKYKEVDCKALLDRLIIDRENKVVKLVDLKTTSNLFDFKSTIEKYRYDLQLAFYSLAITLGIKNVEDYAFEVYIVAVDVNTQEVKVFELSNATLLRVSTELKELLDRAVYHISNNRWDYSMEYYEGNGSESL